MQRTRSVCRSLAPAIVLAALLAGCSGSSDSASSSTPAASTSASSAAGPAAGSTSSGSSNTSSSTTSNSQSSSGAAAAVSSATTTYRMPGTVGVAMFISSDEKNACLMTSDVVECSVAGVATAGGITEVVRLTTSGVQTSTTPDFGGWTVDDGAGDWARSTPSKLHTATGPSQSQAYELAPGAAIGNGWATCTASATSIRCASTSSSFTVTAGAVSKS